MKRVTENCLNKNALLLPIKNKVIFVDWFGVLSEKVFWSKHLNNTGHKMHGKISTLKHKVFENNDLLNEWMRGTQSYENILENYCNELTLKDRKIIKNSLLSYCVDISLNNILFETLKDISDKSFIVLATDNMDCFVESLSKLPQLGIFDSVLSSNFLGVLKGENPDAFFGNWLKNHGLTFQDALLIDDSLSNCLEFKKNGGISLRYTPDDNSLINYVRDWVKN